MRIGDPVRWTDPDPDGVGTVNGVLTEIKGEVYVVNTEEGDALECHQHELRKRVPSKNIYWREIQGEFSPDIELYGRPGASFYIYSRMGAWYAVVFWEGREAKKAQGWLSKHSFIRCAHAHCGVRLGRGGKVGDYCQNHDPQRIYMTTYCNKGHYLTTGEPVDHECMVIPPAALAAERRGNYDEAIRLMQGPRKVVITKEQTLAEKTLEFVVANNVDLDEAVCEVMSEKASEINNQGPEGQVEFLLDEGFDILGAGFGEDT